jgi:HAD superfamily phosphatase (TIGR01668 family)
MKKLKPTYFFDHFSNIQGKWLQEQNIKTIISDLDSTLAPDGKDADESFQLWLNMLEQHEIALIIVSNNHQKRVDSFLTKYKLVGYAKCGKPSIAKIDKELFQKGLEPSTTLFLGDQLFTDMWCGNNLGIQTALVKPIPGHEPWTIRMKRTVEKFIIKNWE